MMQLTGRTNPGKFGFLFVCPGAAAAAKFKIYIPVMDLSGIAGHEPENIFNPVMKGSELNEFMVWRYYGVNLSAITRNVFVGAKKAKLL
jgi:hypothetical protein